MKNIIEKMKGRLVPMTESLWEYKVESIRRFYGLKSKSEAVRKAIEDKYAKICMEGKDE